MVGKCAILAVFCCVETQPIENVQPIEVVQPIENAQRQNILIVYTYWNFSRVFVQSQSVLGKIKLNYQKFGAQNYKSAAPKTAQEPHLLSLPLSLSVWVSACLRSELMEV